MASLPQALQLPVDVLSPLADQTGGGPCLLLKANIPGPKKTFSKTDPMTSCLASSPTLDLLDISSRGLVFYENRALERRFQTTPLPLVPQGAGARDVSAPAEDRDPV